MSLGYHTLVVTPVKASCLTQLVRPERGSEQRAQRCAQRNDKGGPAIGMLALTA